MFCRVPDSGVAYWSWAVVESASGRVVESEAMEHSFIAYIHGLTVTTAFNIKYPQLLNGKKMFNLIGY